MKKYQDLLFRRVRVNTMVHFKNGRKVNTQYIGLLLFNEEDCIVIEEADKTRATINKKHIKRIEGM